MLRRSSLMKTWIFVIFSLTLCQFPNVYSQNDDLLALESNNSEDSNSNESNENSEESSSAPLNTLNKVDFSINESSITTTTTETPATTISVLTATDNDQNLSNKGTQLNITGTSGILMSKNFPEIYPENANFTWNITVQEGFRIELTLHLLSIETNQLCQWDALEIRDSNFTLLKKYCGYLQQDEIITSSNNTMSLYFKSDSVVNLSGFLLSWKAISNDYVRKELNGDQSFMLTIPQTFSSSLETSPEKICLQLFNVTGSGVVNVDLLSNDNLQNESSSGNLKINELNVNDVQCYDFKLDASYSYGYAIVRVAGKFESYEFLSYKIVKVIKVTPLILIQTDRGDYQPQQTIKFRILELDSELKPSSVKTLKEIWIEDPNEARVAQFKNVSLDQGLVQLEFTPVEESPLGQWYIKLKNSNSEEPTVAGFTISESVLPKFEVKIDVPKVILGSDNKTEIKICGIYTHGSRVYGLLNATFTHSYTIGEYWRSRRMEHTTSKLVNLTREMDDGCALIPLNNSEIQYLTFKSAEFSVNASLEEELTGNKQFSLTNVEVQFSPLKISFEDSATTHITGEFPYTFSAKITDTLGAPSKYLITEVCSRLFRSIDKLREETSNKGGQIYALDEDEILALAQKLSSIKYKEICAEYSTNENGILKVSVPLNGLYENVTKLSFKVSVPSFKANNVTRMRMPNEKFEVSLSHSNSSLTISEIGKPIMKCSTTSVHVIFSVPYNVAAVNVSYAVSSGGSLIISDMDTVLFSKSEPKIETHVLVDFDIPVPEHSSSVLRSHSIMLKRPFGNERLISKEIKVLVYIRDEKGAILATSQNYEAESCSVAPSLTWSVNKAHPSEEVTLNITNAIGSNLCGVSILDKSAALVSNPNEITTPKLLQLKEDIANSRIISDIPRPENCKNSYSLFQVVQQLGLHVLNDILNQDPNCNSLIDASQVNSQNDFIQEQVDSPVFAQPLGLAFHSVTSTQRGDALEFMKRKEASIVEVNKPVVEIRNYFPETWLFELVSISSPTHSLKLQAPHTITTWIASAFCSNDITGLVVSNNSELLISQDFFVNLNLPFFVKRGEKIKMSANVFNKVNDASLPIRLELAESKYYTTIVGSSAFYDICLPSNQNAIKSFTIEFNELNDVNVTVSARLSKEVECTSTISEEAYGYSDIIQDSLFVKPEGYPIEIVSSEFVCLENETQSIKLQDVPKPLDLVPDSYRSFFYVTGDILAPAIKNPDQLVQLPTGCGEQNMVRMVPNIYLLDYFNGIDQMNAKLENLAKSYIRIGYSRQNQFRHPDGSYSIWGSKNEREEGSTWLTTYVIKAFVQSTKYIKIDVDALNETINWLLKKQDIKSGCFNDAGYSYSVNSRPDTLTAHVLITLLEAKNNKFEIKTNVYKNAFDCMTRTVSNDTYGMALKTYALTLLETFSSDFISKLGAPKADDFIVKVLSTANTTEHTHWSDPFKGKSYAIETTGYNIISLSLKGHFKEALDAIKWMTKQRNSQGGFYSTQDTVVGLQALTTYSLLTYRNYKVSDIKFKVNDVSYIINGDNKLLLQSHKLEGDALSIVATGTGCFMAQKTTRYNTLKSLHVHNFDLKVNANATQLSICVTYTGAKERTDMVLLEIEPLTGYEFEEYSIESLLNDISNDLEKYEIDSKKEKVVLYFDKMTSQANCFTINMKKVIDVQDLKPALVTVYDYYEQEDKVSSNYIV